MSGTRLITLIGFVLALALFGVVQVIARRDGSKVPPFGEVCGSVMRYRLGRMPVGRIAVLGFWWWVGWHFFAR